MNPSPAVDLSALPYRDTKLQGAPDFYFAINATFRFIRASLGGEGLKAYWEDLGKSYMKPVWNRWRELGLEGIESYWRAFFAAEPGGSVQISRSAGEVVLEVRVCPAIRHLREGGREIVPEFCQHCYYISEAAAREAGYAVRVTGGNGSCRQRFFPAVNHPAPQDMEEIRSC
jgi:hypothetical protein